MNQERINAALQLVRIGNRKINTLRGRVCHGESQEHFSKKEEIFNTLLAHKKTVITEAIFECGLRADIFCLDDFTVYEVAKTESNISLYNKKKKYEEIGIRFKVVRCGK